MTSPDSFYQPLICELYGKSAGELDLLEAAPVEPSVLATLSDVERRRFLQLLAAAGLSASLPDTDQWDRLQKAIRKAGALDTTLLADLEAQTASLHELEREVPARHLSGRLELHLDRLTELLERAPARLRRRLIVTAGDTAALAAWVAWDRGDRASASRLYETATIAAREGDDPALRACILAYASYGAPSPREARELLQGARSFVDRAAYPAVWSWVASREAEEASALGEIDPAARASALRLLEQAKVTFDQAGPKERAWTCFLDRTRMGGFAISTYARLGRTADALQAASATLAELRPGKKRAIVLADIADVHLQQDDVGAVEVGVQLAGQALGAAQETESTVGYDHLRRLRPRLEAWLHVPAARQLHEQLQAL